ncbi:MAG: helix-turn-helix domain-containing protein [Actinomycetota bacterium]
MSSRQRDHQLERAAVLEDELRLRIYRYLRRSGRPATREEVAEEAGISRRLAAFHLEKLLESGLLKSHYARPPGRGGPGAGRSAKYYEPSNVEVSVTIPERHYELAGSLLVDAVRQAAPGESAQDTALRVSAERGREIGEGFRRERRLGRPGPERTISAAQDLLETYGYEPYRDTKAALALRNCPFHALAHRAPELVCAMNRSFIEGVVRGLGNDSVEAVLECKYGDCCVTVRSPERRR